MPMYFKNLPSGAEIAVLLGHVGELVDAIQIRRPIGIFFHPDVSSDAALIQPLQQFTIAVGSICRQSLRQGAITVAIAFDAEAVTYQLHAHCPIPGCGPFLLLHLRSQPRITNSSLRTPSSIAQMRVLLCSVLGQSSAPS